MRAKLVLYEDENGNEYVSIITSPEFEKEMNDDGLKMVNFTNLDGDFITWPSDRLLIQE